MTTRKNAKINKIDFIKSKIYQFNSNFGKDDELELCITIENNYGDVIGGVTGSSYWGVVHIEYLWVSADVRGAGIGARLMTMVESAAIERECNMICLDTFNFQAPDFYLKLGYEIYGRNQGYAGGYERIYLRKFIS